jgi:hypothetical protein
MTPLRIAAAIVAVTFAVSVQGADLNYFVSPSGSDSNPGTEQAPFQTLTRARAVVRAAIPKMTGDIIVTIAGGTYPLSSTLIFGPEDSPLESHRIIYRAAPDAKPVLTGGIKVTGWRPYKDGIWSSAVEPQRETPRDVCE